MKPAILIIVAVMIASCDGNIETPVTTVTGKWVDVDNKTDTLAFVDYEDLKVMEVRRGKEMRDGFLQPKSGSGPYMYQLLGDDRISVQWMAASSISQYKYYFKQKGTTLKIEKFFDTKTTGKILTFRKLN